MSKTYRELIFEAQTKCVEKNLNDQLPIMLLVEISEMENHNLYLEFDEEVEEALLKEFYEKFERLLNNEPLAQILGYEEFYGYKFIVDENVLIPRPETEELVANVLADYDEYFKGDSATLIDVGCGSGAIGISLKKEENNFTVISSDISEKALDIAKKNSEILNADVKFLYGDMLKPFIEEGIKVDILVSNPPYIPNEEKLEASVYDYEPHVALFGGDDGLDFYRSILSDANKILKEKSFMAFEMGYDQKERLTALVKEYFPNARVEVLKDINGKNRMLFVYNNL